MPLLSDPLLWNRPTPPIFVLVIAASVSPLALNMFMPSMPRLIEVFDTTYGTVQLTLGLYLVGVAFFQLVIGPLSDRFGRRPVLIIGLAVYVLGSVLCLAAPDVWTLIAGRVIQAIGGCAGMVLPRAMVRDVYGRDKAASMLGYLVMAMMVIPMLSPVVGGWLEEAFSWRATFLALMLFGVATLALTILLLPETKTRLEPLSGPVAMLRVYAGLLGSPAFVGYAAVLSLTSAGFFSFLGGAPYVVQTIMGAPPSVYGMWFVITSIGYIAGNFTTGRYSQRLGTDRMILGGLVFSVGSSGSMLALGLAGVVEPWAVFVPMMAFAYGNGLTLPSAMAAAISVRPELAGSAAGLAGSMQMGIGFLSSTLTGVVVAGAASQTPLALVMLGGGVGSALAYSALRLRHAARARRQLPPDD